MGVVPTTVLMRLRERGVRMRDTQGRERQESRQRRVGRLIPEDERDVLICR